MTLFIEEYEFLIMNRAGCLIGQKTDEGVKEVSMVTSLDKGTQPFVVCDG